MTKGKRKINILDFLIITLVVLCIIGAVLRIYVKNRDDKFGNDEAIISFLIQDVQYESAALIKDGDRVYSSAYDCEIGNIVGDITYEAAVYYAEDDGKINKTNSGINPVTNEPYRVDLRGKVKCTGTWTDGSGYSLNGTQYIAPNMSIEFCMPNIKATVLITNVEVLKAE